MNKRTIHSIEENLPTINKLKTPINSICILNYNSNSLGSSFRNLYEIHTFWSNSCWACWWLRQTCSLRDCMRKNNSKFHEMHYIRENQLALIKLVMKWLPKPICEAMSLIKWVQTSLFNRGITWKIVYSETGTNLQFIKLGQ